MKYYFLKDFPSLQNFFLISGRHAGVSTKLRGSIALISIYAHSNTRSWTDSSKRRFEAELHKACAWLESEAKRYGVYLRIQPYVYDIAAPLCPDPGQGLHLLFNHFGVSSITQLQKHYESTLQVNEAPLQLVFDYVGRSYAYTQRGSFGFGECPEFSTIYYYYQQDAWSTIAHELLHQFGAIDYYFPDRLRQSAERHFRNSVMGVGDNAVDDLTAYLVGWKDSISENSLRFLQDCSYLTPELYALEQRRS